MMWCLGNSLLFKCRALSTRLTYMPPCYTNQASSRFSLALATFGPYPGLPTTTNSI